MASGIAGGLLYDAHKGLLLRATGRITECQLISVRIIHHLIPYTLVPSLHLILLMTQNMLPVKNSSTFP